MTFISSVVYWLPWANNNDEKLQKIYGAQILVSFFLTSLMCLCHFWKPSFLWNFFIKGFDDFSNNLGINIINELEKSLDYIKMGITWGIFGKEGSLPLVTTKYVQHGSMKNASHCDRNHQTKYSVAAVVVMGSGTSSKDRKKWMRSPSQIILKIRCGFRFAAGNQTQKDIGVEPGNFPFGIYILQQILFSVEQLQ